tara:strand:- start:795 stop:1181 length:387 start_codon:yes stop_codon:yes gene_type:complete
MLNIILSFSIGCIVTYLVTILSSAIEASKILEDAMLTYSLLMMSAYEISTNQLEKAIVAGRVDSAQAEMLRRVNKKEFETFANAKIKEILVYIPMTHTNIIRYKNFKEMNEYVSKQFRSKNDRLNKKI